MKKCNKCGLEQPLSEFYTHGQRKDGGIIRRPDCKTCVKKRVGDSRDYEKDEARQARRFYGLTLEEARELWHADKCAICGTTDPKDNRQKFHIDHCHETGKVRGALCSKCNFGIGFLQDSPDVLRLAAEYLERARCEKA